MADVWEKYKKFSNHHRKEDEEMSNFLPNWEISYQKLKAMGCDYTDSILGLKLLEDAQLNDMDTKLVLTGVDLKAAQDKKDLQKQISSSLKKFSGRTVIFSGRVSDNLAVSVKAEPTFLVSQMEEVLIAKGWKPPTKGRRRSRSESPLRRKSNYQGKKNALGENGKPKKCYICKCDHGDNCNCPCVYHLANTCPQRKPRVASGENKQVQQSGKTKLDLGLFVDSNISTYLVTEEDQVFLIHEK